MSFCCVIRNLVGGVWLRDYLLCFAENSIVYMYMANNSSILQYYTACRSTGNLKSFTAQQSFVNHSGTQILWSLTVEYYHYGKYSIGTQSISMRSRHAEYCMRERVVQYMSYGACCVHGHC